MSGGEDWLMRPVVRGLVPFVELKRTSIDLCDIAMMNEALDVEDENRARVAEAVRGN